MDTSLTDGTPVAVSVETGPGAQVLVIRHAATGERLSALYLAHVTPTILAAMSVRTIDVPAMTALVSAGLAS